MGCPCRRGPQSPPPHAGVGRPWRDPPAAAEPRGQGVWPPLPGRCSQRPLVILLGDRPPAGVVLMLRLELHHQN